MKPIIVSIVDSHAGARQKIAGQLKADEGFQCVSQFDRAEDALEMLPLDRPDVVLMEIQLDGMDGIECVRCLKTRMPEVQVIMLTTHTDAESIFAAFRAGANGYLLKPQPPGKLMEAIREVFTGGSPMSATVARKVVQLFQTGGPSVRMTSPDRLELSTRECEVLDQLAAGKPYKRIGDSLDVSVHTVRSYVRRIYQKLHVHTRTEAVAKYLK